MRHLEACRVPALDIHGAAIACDALDACDEADRPIGAARLVTGEDLGLGGVRREYSSRRSYVVVFASEPSIGEAASVSTIGFRGNPEWADMSDYVVHFTKGSGTGDKNRTAYDNIISILHGQKLVPGPAAFGSAVNILPLKESQRCVCFSEIPLGYLQRLVARRSSHGIAFRKPFVVSQGGAPVWYVDRGSPTELALDALRKRALQGKLDPQDPMWKLTPLIDHPYDDGNRKWRFEWEREWRVPGEVKFKSGDVAFLFLEERLHAAARGFFDGAEQDNTGPNYKCPFIDPQWELDRVAAALKPLARP